ncbi:MAG TPA: winged helix-turn-helix domain-containing protein, partial [Candidatus Acidoferrum sp.]|nr:winged helix-turn-helix domain-containing protein [Candidatus Acidoferrum sp.]
MATGPKILYEFGPFRLDPEKQVLYRDSQPVPVTPKALETLLFLVRRSREDVSKDDLMKALWPDSFVEEANLSQNIFVLRKALGDTPEDRRYIVTLPGRGYRFAADVRTVTEGASELVIAGQSRSRMVIEQTDAGSGETLRVLPASVSRASWKYVLPAAIAVVLLVLGAISLLLRRPALAIGEKDSVLIADFANSTGDPVFDDTLRQGLAVQLEQSPYLSLVSPERVQQTLRLMNQPPDARLTPQLARDVCQRTGGSAVLEGSIASLGSQYVLGLRAVNCRTGDLLDEEQTQASKKENVLNALSRMATKFRGRVGESLSAIREHDVPLSEATTPSLDALKAYSLGRRVLSSTGSAAAVPLFQRAIELDPKFAVAHAWLGRVYGDLGEFDLSAASTGKAYELRDRASDRERFFITASYELQVTGNLEKAQQASEAWAQAYPREMIPHAFLSGIVYPVLGQYEKSVEEGKKMIQLDPDFANGYDILAYGYEYLGRVEDAEATLRLASERKLEVPEYIVHRYDLAFLKGEKAAMDREVALAAGDPEASYLIAHHEAFVS